MPAAPIPSGWGFLIYGVGGYHGRAELDLLRWSYQGTLCEPEDGSPRRVDEGVDDGLGEGGDRRGGMGMG